MEATFTQDTLTDNKQIFERIYFELTQAKEEILVAMAWFTDSQLFEVLESKLEENVRVSIIISEQPDNEKLDFSRITSKGGEVVRIKNVGYGMMHQKFCIIDKKLAISGSYNWTVNARTNNHETVIFTNYEKTVNELINTFNSIRFRAVRLSQGESIDEVIKSETNLDYKALETNLIAGLKETPSIQEQSIIEFKNVLDKLIAAEVGNFDKDLLRETGYTRSRDNNGDHQILPQAMDSVYSNFINEIEVIEERKKKLVSKIEEQQRLSSGSLESKIAYEEIRLNEENRVATENGKKNILDLEIQRENFKLEILNNTTKKIPYLKGVIESIRNKINFAEREFIKPAINWPILITSSLLSLFLAIYIFIFYSSVAYIFIFSKQDANEMIIRGLAIEVPEIFNPHVFEKLSDKGIGGLMFLFFFVAIPYCLGLMHILKHTNTNNRSPFLKWYENNLWLFLIVIVDTFIAFKVSKNINEIEFITNRTDKRLSFFEVFISDNFLLVFVLGALGIYLFKISTSKLYSLFDERNPSSAERQNRILIEQHLQEISERQEEIHIIELENSNLDTKIAGVDKEIEKLKIVIDNLPIKLNDSLSLLKQELEQGKERLLNLSSIYNSYVENDKLPISITALDDRINVFLEGWSKYLHDTYSMQLAEKKTAVAILEIDNWKNQKILNTKLQLN